MDSMQRHIEEENKKYKDVDVGKQKVYFENCCVRVIRESHNDKKVKFWKKWNMSLSYKKVSMSCNMWRNGDEKRGKKNKVSVSQR